MEYTKETLNELTELTERAYDYSKAKALNSSTSDNYELDVLRFYIAELEDKLKFNIQLKNDWKQKATKLQVK